MIQPGDHIADQILSAAIDDQLSPDEARRANAHLASCPACRARLDALRSVVGLLRGLPSVEAPRDFSLGPRLVAADPPNVVRLRRWYGVARAGAASLAAVFVFLSAGALYLDSRSVASNTGVLSAQPQTKVRPAVEGAPAAQNPAPPAAAASPAARPLAPAAPAPQPPASRDAGAPAAAAGAAAARSQPAPTPPGGGAADQVTAGTSVRALPTQVPTPVPLPTVGPQPSARPVGATGTDSAAPLRAAAATAGVLSVLGLIATLVIRHRLRAASTSATE